MPNKSSTIPRFHFPHGNPTSAHGENNTRIITTVKQWYGYNPYLVESQFSPITKICNLPRYLNIVFFRKLTMLEGSGRYLSLSGFIEGWKNLTKNRYDSESLFFSILKKPESNTLSPEDFLPVLEDIILNHPGLQFLSDNPMFQERYIETVICRLFYEAKCASGQLTLLQFRKSGFTQMIKNLTPNIDLNNTRDCFSYKHFYVLYCKFWILDEDHDLIISDDDLLNYKDDILSPKLVSQIMQHGRIPAFARDRLHYSSNNIPTLTYLDFIWFFLSEIDKSTPTAIEYWFRCMDTDGDGIITSYELTQYWEDNSKKLQYMNEISGEDDIQFDDLIRQLNDLIQPRVPGQFQLLDLKQNGMVAERFFDTFLNVEKFQYHDACQGLMRANQQLERERRKNMEIERMNNLQINESKAMKHDHTFEDYIYDHYTIADGELFEPFSLGNWCDYAEAEYHMLVLSEKIESIDSDCGSRGDLEERQLTEEDIDEYTRLLMSEQMDENSRKKLMMELVALKNRDISSDVKDNQDEAFKNDESCDEEEKGPKEEEGDDDGSSSQENGDEIESDPSSPSTPVLPTDSENELTKCYLKEFKEAKLVGIDNS